MRSKYVIIGCMLSGLLSTGSLAQSGWYHLPSPGDFSAIFFVDSLNGWVGGPGGISRTTDGGTTWTPVNLPLVAGIRRIAFPTRDLGFAVGDSGAILKSTNGGVSWVQKQSGTSRMLNSVYFLDDVHGWACGGDTVLFTTDQGETWLARQAPAISLWDISFRNAQQGLVVGVYGSCYKTTDGGDSWNPVEAPLSGVSLFGISFLDSLQGIVIGGGQIALTTDGGTSWVAKYSNMQSQLNSISFPDSLNGWVVGQDKILKTTNGGRRWTEQPWPPPSGYLLAVHSPDKNHCYAIGAPVFLKTVDGGGVTSVSTPPGDHPEGFTLYQNYPNPFNPTTSIDFELSHPSFTTLKVLDPVGRLVATLLEGEMTAGRHSIRWNATPFASGLYFYSLRSGSFWSVKKLILQK